MTRDPAVAIARARCAAAKARLDASIAAARHRLSPRTLAGDAVDGAKERAIEAAQSGLQAARERPAVAGAIIGAIGLALAHRPLLGWIGSLFGRHDATGDDDAS